LAQNLSKNKIDPFACSIVKTLMGTMTLALFWRDQAKSGIIADFAFYLWAISLSFLLLTLPIT
jgi:hypothetical protein